MTVHLGQMPASTYAALPPKMQKACRIMVNNGEMTIENVPGMPAGCTENAVISGQQARSKVMTEKSERTWGT